MRKVDAHRVFIIDAPMLRSLPHPIRPKALSVFSGDYPIGFIADEASIGRGWTWALHPNGLPISVSGNAATAKGAEDFLAIEWGNQLSALGLETCGAEEPGQATLEVQQLFERYFSLTRCGAQVGNVMIISPGAGWDTFYRWEVADHPEQIHRIGYATDLGSAVAGAQIGWQAWLKWAGLRPKPLQS